MPDFLRNLNPFRTKDTAPVNRYDTKASRVTARSYFRLPCDWRLVYEILIKDRKKYWDRNRQQRRFGGAARAEPFGVLRFLQRGLQGPLDA